MECQLPKVDVGGLNPLARHKSLPNKHLYHIDQVFFPSEMEEKRSL